MTDWVDEPNGLAFSPDEAILYVSDTSAAFRTDGAGNRHIVAFDVVDGRTLDEPRVFYTMEVGFSDGFRVDTRGTSGRRRATGSTWWRRMAIGWAGSRSRR